MIWEVVSIVSLLFRFIFVRNRQVRLGNSGFEHFDIIYQFLNLVFFFLFLAVVFASFLVAENGFAEFTFEFESLKNLSDK